MSQIFNREYYAVGLGDSPYERSGPWLHLFHGMADHIKEEIQPQSVLDAGCAMGMLVECLRDLGIEAFGFDISDYALAQARDDIKEFLWEGSVTDPLLRRYDLIVAIEVLEHMPSEMAKQAIENLCAHTDQILFSSTPDDFSEPTHINVQPPESWAALFAREGFIRDFDFDASFVAPWSVLFRRRVQDIPRIVKEYERFGARLDRENSVLRRTLRDSRDELGQTRDALAALEKANEESDAALAAMGSRLDAKAAEVDAIREMITWRAVSRVRSLTVKAFPMASKRGRLMRGIVRRVVG